MKKRGQERDRHRGTESERPGERQTGVERERKAETIPHRARIEMAVHAARPSGHSGKTHRNKNNGWKWTRGRYTPAPRHFFLLAETYKHPGLPAISAGPADRQTALPAVSVRPSKFEAPRPVVTPSASLSSLLKTVAIFFFEQREGARAPRAAAIKMSSAFCK